ncbi:MAG: protein-L-isoaspartate O-methyltransferase [Rhodovibrionaceae bacterium]|nr:protein-L-isoaspartate O-methyltransferase [Rhodovibrionaceae bacterium]
MKLPICAVAAALLFLTAGAPAEAQESDDFDAYAVARTLMLRDIEVSTMKTARFTGTEFMDGKVLRAIRLVPRHLFLPEDMRESAYDNARQEIRDDLNLESPFVVALINQVAAIQPGDRVLVAATGTGYHPAVLSSMAAEVYAVDGIEAHTAQARRHLERLEIANVETRTGDSYRGWPEKGPFDVIILKQSLDHVPKGLVAQLKPGGRMVMPLGPADTVQRVTLIEKNAQGELNGRHVLEAYFPPLLPGDRT